MKKIIITAAVLALSALAPAQAQEKKLNAWQHCGIGAMIFTDNGVAAAISNIIWDLGTTAVTSASASEESCKGSRAVTARFVTETYNELENEIVSGEGAHLSAMLTLMQCDAIATPVIRAQMAESVVGSDASQVVKAEQLFNIAEAACSAS
jgi:hypothetical protein